MRITRLSRLFLCLSIAVSLNAQFVARSNPADRDSSRFEAASSAAVQQINQRIESSKQWKTIDSLWLTSGFASAKLDSANALATSPEPSRLWDHPREHYRGRAPPLHLA